MASNEYWKQKKNTSRDWCTRYVRLVGWMFYCCGSRHFRFAFSTQLHCSLSLLCWILRVDRSVRWKSSSGKPPNCDNSPRCGVTTLPRKKHNQISISKLPHPTNIVSGVEVSKRESQFVFSSCKQSIQSCHDKIHFRFLEWQWSDLSFVFTISWLPSEQTFRVKHYRFGVRAQIACLLSTLVVSSSIQKCCSSQHAKYHLWPWTRLPKTIAARWGATILLGARN